MEREANLFISVVKVSNVKTVPPCPCILSYGSGKTQKLKRRNHNISSETRKLKQSVLVIYRRSYFVLTSTKTPYIKANADNTREGPPTFI